MPDNKKLFNELFKNGVISNSGQINDEFYEGVLSPTTGKYDGPSLSNTPNTDLYEKEFAPFDEIYKKSMTGDLWKINQNDQGPGTRDYQEPNNLKDLEELAKQLQGKMK
jgi:hypothetical protein